MSSNRGRAFVVLDCGHSHRRRELASPGSELLQCPHCGEFREVVSQDSEAKPLRRKDDAGNLALFDDPADLDDPPF